LCLVTIVNASFEQLTDSEFWKSHIHVPFPVYT
jgi:hypothetical protein